MGLKRSALWTNTCKGDVLDHVNVKLKKMRDPYFTLHSSGGMSRNEIVK